MENAKCKCRMKCVKCKVQSDITTERTAMVQRAKCNKKIRIKKRWKYGSGKKKVPKNVKKKKPTGVEKVECAKKRD